MQRLRFMTAPALFEAFPTALADVGAASEDRDSLDYVGRLAEGGNLVGALTFCAYLLPRREAVYWACQSLRGMPGAAPTARDAACLEAAERWVRTPDEPLRYEAARQALAGEQTAPETFAAYAAGYAGRNLVPPELGQAPVAPQLTAQSLRCMFLLASLRVPSERQDEWRRQTLADGIRLAT